MSNRTGILNGMIILPETHSGTLKQIELFDKDLNKRYSQWVWGEDFLVTDLQPSIYMIRLSLPSGLTKEQVVNITNGENTIVLDATDKSEDSDLRIRTKANVLEQISSQLIGYYSSSLKLKAKLWTSQDGREFELSKIVEPLQDKGGDFIIDLTTYSCTNILEIQDARRARTLISIPPLSNVKININSVLDRNLESNLYDISVTTDNLKSDALLALLSRGDIKNAKTLVNPDDEAERLLYDKVEDTSAAAIGGYFLLKMGKLERLHDWAQNLANWFPWLPDGSIIYAWQMIQKQDKNNLNEIRKYLIRASERMPVYTEGFRLLNEGLGQLSYATDHNDTELEAAYNKVKKCLPLIDWNQQTTTFNLESAQGNQLEDWRDIFVSPSVALSL